MSLKVSHDGSGVVDPLESCCICLKRTRYWHRSDVALCPECAKTAYLADLPTKKEWFSFESIRADDRFSFNSRKEGFLKELKISMMVAVSSNGIIGDGPKIPWNARGEQLLFKAVTFGQWILIGRKTFESMGELPDRKYAIISRTMERNYDDFTRPLVFPSVLIALKKLSKITDHVIVCGGGEIYNQMLPFADTLHISTIHQDVKGDIKFPSFKSKGWFRKVYSQHYKSNTDYTYKIYDRFNDK